MMLKLLGKVACLFRGHRRGRRDNNMVVNLGEQGYRCPRCGATWVRKVKRNDVS